MTQVIAIALLAVSLSSCANGGLWAKRIGVDIAGCAVNALPSVAQTFVPTVLTILESGQPNWNQQLNALSTLGGDMVLCAVQRVIHDLRNPAGGARATPGDDAAIERGNLFLKHRGAKALL